jgi:hypothetical protein
MENKDDDDDYDDDHSDKFHIQWCLYTMMDLWDIINE